MGRARKVTEEANFFRREFDIDLEEEYRKLKEIATLNEDELKDKEVLMKKLNRVAYAAHQANKIYLKARRERELFRMEFDAEMRNVTRMAIARIQAWFERTENIRKQITKEMISQEIAANEDTREKYKDMIEKQEDLREIRDNLHNLAQQWNDRKSLLQTHARLLNYEKTVVLGKGN